MSGRLVLMGSGELAPTMVATHRETLASAGADRITVLDTPFGFQENVEQLTTRIVDYFETSLRVGVEVAVLRSADEPELVREKFLSAIRRSRCVFAGPGSPSYALAAWHPLALSSVLRRVVEAGGAVVLASAAALTAGVKTVPVYEIYKVGMTPFWLVGLDLLGAFGVSAAVIPHWNNTEGGNHDTSRCYIGRRRLAMLTEELDAGILGIDEHTAAIIDFSQRTLKAAGAGSVWIGEGREVPAGETVALHEVESALGPAPVVPRPAPTTPSLPDFRSALGDGDAGAAVAAVLSAEEEAARDPRLRPELRGMVVDLGEAAEVGLENPRDRVAGFVAMLLDLREEARSAGRYDDADRIRQGLDRLGVEVRDTPSGPEWYLSA